AMTRGHAEAVMPLIARVMSAASIEFADLDRIAVTTGPGSFTGLRVGISATRGIALAAGKPAVRLSPLPRLAAPALADDDSTQVVAGIDARHEQVYLQVFGSGGRTLVAPRIASVRDAARAAMTAPARIIGSAANKVAAAWPKGAEPPLSVEQRGAPDIDWIARLGAAAAEDHAPPKPLYLRAPDAQPQDAARLRAGPADDRDRQPAVRARARAVGSRPARRPCFSGAPRRLLPSRVERRRIRALAFRSQCHRPSCHGGTQPHRVHRVTASARRGGDPVDRRRLRPAGEGTGAATARYQSAPPGGARRALGVSRGGRGPRARAAP